MIILVCFMQYKIFGHCQHFEHLHEFSCSYVLSVDTIGHLKFIMNVKMHNSVIIGIGNQSCNRSRINYITVFNQITFWCHFFSGHPRQYLRAMVPWLEFTFVRWKGITFNLRLALSSITISTITIVEM